MLIFFSVLYFYCTFSVYSILGYFYSTPSLVAIEVQTQEKSKRCSNTREFKLHVIKWYMGNGQNKARTVFHFKVGRKRVRELVQNEQQR